MTTARIPTEPESKGLETGAKLRHDDRVTVLPSGQKPKTQINALGMHEKSRQKVSNLPSGQKASNPQIRGQKCLETACMGKELKTTGANQKVIFFKEDSLFQAKQLWL
jgi:hypothetical protein